MDRGLNPPFKSKRRYRRSVKFSAQNSKFCRDDVCVYQLRTENGKLFYSVKKGMSAEDHNVEGGSKSKEGSGARVKDKMPAEIGSVAVNGTGMNGKLSDDQEYILDGKPVLDTELVPAEDSKGEGLPEAEVSPEAAKNFEIKENLEAEVKTGEGNASSEKAEFELVHDYIIEEDTITGGEPVTRKEPVTEKDAVTEKEHVVEKEHVTGSFPVAEEEHGTEEEHVAKKICSTATKPRLGYQLTPEDAPKAKVSLETISNHSEEKKRLLKFMPKVYNEQMTYRVEQSLCLRQPMSTLTTLPNICKLPYDWPWAEKPEDFFIIAETDREKEPRNEVCSRSMLRDLEEMVGLKPVALYPPPTVPTPLSPFPVLKPYYQLDSPRRAKATLEFEEPRKEAVGHVEQSKDEEAPSGLDDEKSWTTVDTAALLVSPKLEESIPVNLLPGVLHVHDPADMVRQAVWGDHECFQSHEGLIDFGRVHPPRDPEDNHNSAALTIEGRLGSGNHSSVFQGILTLPEGYQDTTNGKTVTVAVKVSNHEVKDRNHLKKEALTYTMMSIPQRSFLQEHWPGYIVCSGAYGFAKQQIECGDGPTISPLGAVVPKFFGYYKPWGIHNQPNLFKGCRLLIMEDCGQSVHDFKASEEYQQMEWASKLNIERTLACQVSAMMASLCSVGFLQGSPKFKNMTIQPGPLSIPTSERSIETPSFRIIDFGRVSIHIDQASVLFKGYSIECIDFRKYGIERSDSTEFKVKAQREMRRVLSMTLGRLECLERDCYCCIHDRTEVPSCTSHLSWL